jgi:hypothetical protein
MKVRSFPVTLWILLAVAFYANCQRMHAEAHCPGNIASLHPRLVAGALLVIPVTVNQSGPYDFMVDTGSQLNVIDPALASQLAFQTQGSVALVRTATSSQASVGILDSLQVDGQQVFHPVAVVQDLGAIQMADRHIRGVLGENFLAHFDVLIDYEHRLLCLDQKRLMERALRGERLPLVRQPYSAVESPLSPRLVISVNLSGMTIRPVLLQLDSGSDGHILYPGRNDLQQSLLKYSRLQGREVSEGRRAFAIVPPQDMRIGSQTLRNTQFVTPISVDANIPYRQEDGLLATALLHRLFISHTHNYVVLDPK